MSKKTFKRIMIFLLAAIMLFSTGYIVYKKVIEPAQHENMYDDVREAYEKGEISFPKPSDDSSKNDHSSRAGDTSSNSDESSSSPDNSDSSDSKTGYTDGEATGGSESYTYEYTDRMIGWIKIPGTNIDYPVMYKERDNSYYLTHDYANRYDTYGSIYLDGYQYVGAQNMTLYGHNINAAYKAMFRELLNYERQSYLNDHPTVYFNIGEGEQEYEVIGCLILNVSKETLGFARCEFSGEKDLIDFAQNLYDHCTAKRSGIEFSADDEFLTLVTCSYHYNNCRTVVLCRKK